MDSLNEQPFQFKEFDQEGLETLRVLSDAKNFNDWTFEAVAPFCEGKILEIGSGIGNISSRFINTGADITLSEVRIQYKSFLEQQFPDLRHQNKIIHLDLVHPRFENEYANLEGTFDTVFALNVIEHIYNDSLAVSNCKSLLKPGGKLIILVPAFQSLYNTFDKELYHYKRYGRKDLLQLFRNNNLKIKKSFFFNAAGIPGWIISGNFLKNKTIPAGQMNIFNRLVPLFKFLDTILLKSVGLSVVCIGEK